MRALVIDDSRAMRRIVGGTLENLGFGVNQAGDGREGLDVLDTGWVPDLVCVDWNMPVMDGLQFVSAVRSNPAASLGGSCRAATNRLQQAERQKSLQGDL